MADPNVTAQEAAQTTVTMLREQARVHKRLVSHHRREAQRIMATLTDVQRACLLAGITIDIDTPEAPSHGQRRSAS